MTQSSNVPILGQWCPEHLRTSAPGWGISHKHLIGPAMTANFWPRITWVQSSSPLKMFVVHLPGLLVMSSSLECLCLWDTPLPFWVKHIHVHWSILLPGLCYTKGKYVSKGWLRWSVQVLEQYISSTWTIIEFPWKGCATLWTCELIQVCRLKQKNLYAIFFKSRYFIAFRRASTFIWEQHSAL